MKKHLIFLTLVILLGMTVSLCSCELLSADETAEDEITQDETDSGKTDSGDTDSSETDSSETDSGDTVHEHSYTVTSRTATCTKDGKTVYTCSCGDTYTEETEKLGHDFDVPEGDYFSIGACKREGCTVCGRRDSERNYDDVFVYEYDEAKQAEMDERYQTLLNAIAEIALGEEETPYEFIKDSDHYNENKTFEKTYYVPFVDDVEYVIEQYEYCYVFYCVADGEDGWGDKYSEISDVKTEMISKYYALFRTVYETKYRNYFFSEEDGWDEESIRQILIQADSYGDPKYLELQKRADEIAIEFREISDQGGDSKVLTLYEEFIEVNNSIAKLAGYDNYMDYAYESVYGRDYTPADVAEMRKLVKSNLGGSLLYQLLCDYYVSGTTAIEKSDWNKLFSSDASISVLDSAAACDAVKSYLESMGTLNGEQDVNFFHELSDLFRNGNYYTGAYSGAFSYYIDAQDATILYFGPGSYSTSFTFIHEFGHYINSVYNGSTSLTLDLDEIHSQGNEMLFLASLESYLKENYSNADTAFEYIEEGKTADCLIYILLCTAVDEFEEICYTGKYDGTNKGIAKIVEDGKVSANEFDRLFELVLGEYDSSGYLNTAYWRYVTIEAPGYYISYAMSLVPSVELYVMAKNDGLEAAQTAYKKLITFTDVDEYVTIDGAGDKVVDISLKETLDYAGISSPFDSDTYKALKTFFRGFLY